MTTSSTPSPQDGRDPGVTLIRISPARIQTQVTQTVRYRPVRSLLLLGILVVVSLVVLFTLSQMAFVQHTMMAQLETGRPGGGAWVGSNGGGRISRPAQKPWKSQFNQFKIEPLLIRNAPSVEVNTALAANRRRASQVAAIIMKNSLLVTESPYYNLSLQYIHLAPDNDQNPSKQSSSHTPSFISLPVHKEHIIHLHNMSTSASHLQSHGIIRAPSQSNLTSSSLSPLSSSMSSLASTSLSLDRLPPSSNPRVRHSKERGALIQGSTSLSVINTSSNNFFISSLSSPAPSLSHHKHDINSVNTSTKVLQNHKNKTATDKTMYDINNNKSDKMNDKQSRNSNELSEKSMRDHRKREENVRKRFFRKLGCADSDICDSEKPYYENHKVVINKQIRENQQRKNETKNKKRCVNDSHKECYTERKDVPKVTEKFVAAPVAAYSLATTAKPSESIESESESLPTEFSPSEKDFEPLYLREDDSYDSADEEVDTLPSTPPDITTKATTPTDKELRKLSVCPEIPPGLRGKLDINLDHLEELRLSEVLKDLEWVMPGGRWSPAYEPSNPCLPRHKVAVILPYRDRLHHLIILLSWLHPILRRQQLEYTIYVAEQAGNVTFNKGSIMNAGFMEAWQRSDANCFVFHDVDLLPEDDRNMYSCPPQPRHLSVGVDTLGYKLPYFLLVGGVLSVRGDHFLRLNGYSNMYWGWGGEDDDMGYRIKQSGLSITRPPNMLARYTMIRHLKRRPLTWKVRGKLVRTSGRRYRLDGLNTLKYSLLSLHKHPLFTHLLLDVGTPPENLVRLDAH